MQNISYLLNCGSWLSFGARANLLAKMLASLIGAGLRELYRPLPMRSQEHNQRPCMYAGALCRETLVDYHRQFIDIPVKFPQDRIDVVKLPGLCRDTSCSVLYNL